MAYINKQSVMCAIAKVKSYSVCDCGDYVQRSDVFNAVNTIPPDNAAPVKCGSWLLYDERFPEKQTDKRLRLGVFCTECDKYADNDFKFCPNCGAVMLNAEKYIDRD